MRKPLVIDANHYAMYCYFASKKISEDKYKEKQREWKRQLQRIDPETQKEEFAKAVAKMDDPLVRDLIVLDGFKTMWHNKLIELIVQNRYDGIIFGMEGGDGWRKGIYPEYKANRKPKFNPKTNKMENKFGSPEQETRFFDASQECVDTLTKFAPSIRVLKVRRAEGDDCIAEFVKWASKHRPSMLVTIMSRDRDYLQLFKYGNCRLYDPQERDFIPCNDPEYALQTKIICGDTSDNIKNVRRGYGEVKAMEYYNKGKMDEFLSVGDARQKYDLNRQLVDFGFIPKEISDEIINQIDKISTTNHILKNVRDLHNYYITNGFFRTTDTRFQSWYDILKNPNFGNLTGH